MEDAPPISAPASKNVRSIYASSWATVNYSQSIPTIPDGTTGTIQVIPTVPVYVDKTLLLTLTISQLAEDNGQSTPTIPKSPKDVSDSTTTISVLSGSIFKTYAHRSKSLQQCPEAYAIKYQSD